VSKSHISPFWGTSLVTWQLFQYRWFVLTFVLSRPTLHKSKSCWMSKWHPEILQWHPKLWKPRYGFVFYWSKVIRGKHVFLHVAIAKDGWNDRPTQFTGAKVESGDWKHGICPLPCVPSRFGLLRHCRRFVCCVKMRKHFTAIMEVFCCFNVAIGMPGDASDWNEDKRSAIAARMQNRGVVNWGSCESC